MFGRLRNDARNDDGAAIVAAGDIGDLGSGESEGQKGDSAEKLADDCDCVGAGCGWETSEDTPKNEFEGVETGEEACRRMG